MGDAQQSELTSHLIRFAVHGTVAPACLPSESGRDGLCRNSRKATGHGAEAAVYDSSLVPSQAPPHPTGITGRCPPLGLHHLTAVLCFSTLQDGPVPHARAGTTARPTGHTLRLDSSKPFLVKSGSLWGLLTPPPPLWLGYHSLAAAGLPSKQTHPSG